MHDSANKRIKFLQEICINGFIATQYSKNYISFNFFLFYQNVGEFVWHAKKKIEKCLKFQACRGKLHDDGIVCQDNMPSGVRRQISIERILPTHADFLLAHSSAEGNEFFVFVGQLIVIRLSLFFSGFSSFGFKKQGSWYIQSLCNIIDQNYKQMDLVKMLTLTASKVARDFISGNHWDRSLHMQKQVPDFVSMLIKELYFLQK